jgi:hypothetical protein
MSTLTETASTTTVNITNNLAASKFVTIMKEGNPLLLIEFGVLANKEVMEDFKKLAKKRKKKKKKKKKKKGKKKGKKK